MRFVFCVVFTLCFSVVKCKRPNLSVTNFQMNRRLCLNKPQKVSTQSSYHSRYLSFTALLILTFLMEDHLKNFHQKATHFADKSKKW